MLKEVLPMICTLWALCFAQGKVVSSYGGEAEDYHPHHVPNLFDEGMAAFRSPGSIDAHVQAIVRGSAQLPCDLTGEQSNDTVVLVVWYKDDSTPIYSYDRRGAHSNSAKLWKDQHLDGRSFFRVMTEPAALSIDNIGEKDEGEYRCRIDYLRSPTKNYRVSLSVIVPPQKPTIFDERGKDVPTLTGPYEEGGDMKLTCIVRGGKPEPTIKWWREGRLLESIDTPSGFPDARSNQLIVRNLQRSDQHASFTCQASNNNISQPVSATTSIEIYFRPLNVEILTSNNPLSADRSFELPCQTFGSRPPAKITWILNGQELKPPKYNVTQSNSPDGNSTTSNLTFIPTRKDNGSLLTCRASNNLVQSGVEEDTVKLNVFYVPIPRLSFGSNLNPNDIEEGDDVYFECNVDANPLAYKVLWKHNGQVMQANQKAGVIISATALALRNLTRNQAGNYSCIASNVEGDGESNVLQLNIMYKPICQVAQKNKIYGVARHENAKIYCEVESYPPPDSFFWMFNNSAESTHVPENRYKQGEHNFSSVLVYTPVTDLDYGTVMCWANNFSGKQMEPCVFHIIPAAKPDPPSNCSIVNTTNDSLEVDCVEGFDGGVQQKFQIEVYDAETGVLQLNKTSPISSFTVNVASGMALRMYVYASNGKGRSDAVVLERDKLKQAEKQTVLSLGTRDELEVAPILGILVGVVAALLLVTVVVLGALKIKASRREGSRALRPGFLPMKEKAVLPLRSESEDLFEKDDKNPDVIPSNKDSDYQLGSAVQTPGLNNSVSTAEYEVATVQQTQPQQQPNATPLTEAYLARDRAYQPQHAGEVTYAELSLVRPNSLEGNVKNGVAQFGSLRRNHEEPTIYAQIDHSRRAAPPIPTKPSPIISPVTSLFPKQGLYHREVVTVRTPLMGCQQESCV